MNISAESPKDGTNDGPPHEGYADGSDDGASNAEARVPVAVGLDLASESARVTDILIFRNVPPRLFSNANASAAVELRGSEFSPITRDRVAVVAAENCAFYIQFKKGHQKPTYPPPRLIGAVADSLPKYLPILRGIKTAPFFYKGNLVGHESGYHEESGYYSVLSDRFDISLEPQECVRRLDDLLGQFPYESQGDRANAIGMVVGQILKAQWVSPLLFVDKPTSQTGATKLCQTIAALADGQPIATLTQGRSAEETDKRIISKLVIVPPGILIDNASRTFASDIIVSGLTSPFTGARKLGGHEEALVSTLALQWYVTGINVSVSPDMMNRALSVRLNAEMEHPEVRTGFRHKLPDDAFAYRAYYFSAALSLVKHWIDAGCPSGTATTMVLDSFSGWMKAVGGILEQAGIQGFHANRENFLERTGIDHAQAREFVSLWYQAFQQTPQQTASLLDIANTVFDLSGKDRAGEAQSLGHKLRAIVDQVFTIGDVDVAVRRNREGVSKYHLESTNLYSQRGNQGNQEE